MLGVFKANKINLTWIESFPYREAKGEYVFFVDFEGHRDDPKVKKALAALEEICDTVSVLGSFPLGEAVGRVSRTWPAGRGWQRTAKPHAATACRRLGISPRSMNCRRVSGLLRLDADHTDH